MRRKTEKKTNHKKRKNYNRDLPYIFNKPSFLPLEIIHILFLKCFRSRKKNPLLNEEAIDAIKQIVNSVNSNELSLLNQLDSRTKRFIYFRALNDCQVYYRITDHWCLIITSHHNCYEIVEFDAVGGKCDDILQVYDYIQRNFKYRPFIADCRESTSYALLVALERSGRVKIEEDHARLKNKEMMHGIKFRIIRQR